MPTIYINHPQYTSLTWLDFMLAGLILVLCGCTQNQIPAKEEVKNNNVHIVNAMDTIYSPSRIEETYAIAIADYIRLVQVEYGLEFDTLYFGKHQYNQSDDFPDITLPDRIGSTYVRLVSMEEGVTIQKQKKSSYYINLIGVVESLQSQFTFVTFSHGFVHQFDALLEYKFDRQTGKLVLSANHWENFALKSE
ncbi:MAG: hypothetical protein K1X54_09535 [Flavobacteriales bacterium]|nr:hypothetical protein [Flavobacteriales bacterium]